MIDKLINCGEAKQVLDEVLVFLKHGFDDKSKHHLFKNNFRTNSNMWASFLWQDLA